MTIKTAISVEEALFEKVEALAQELAISRSRLFALAAEEYIAKHENQHLLQALNEAYADFPDPQEATLQRQQRAHQREIVEDQW